MIIHDQRHIHVIMNIIVNPTSVQKIWPTAFFAKKMPCILHGAAKKIRDTISSQVSGLAQLPDDLKFRVDQESNTYKSGGETWSILSQSIDDLSFCDLYQKIFTKRERVIVAVVLL